MEKTKRIKLRKATGSLQSFSKVNQKPWQEPPQKPWQDANSAADQYSQYSRQLYRSVDITKN